MPRPYTCRRIEFRPEVTRFKPVGIPGRELISVTLSMDELEAVRLADLHGLYQEAAAESMGVSRQTLGNILESARRKIADCLVNGKLLKIEGGRVVMTGRSGFGGGSCGRAGEGNGRGDGRCRRDQR
jgi:predicted DNA-binding protein (UPF0251 family)